jgi:hypothetical protein
MFIQNQTKIHIVIFKFNTRSNRKVNKKLMMKFE